jgi:hypothetical protein
MLGMQSVFCLCVSFLAAPTASAFLVLTPSFSTPHSFSTPLQSSASDWGAGGNGAGAIEQIEFKIYPDGRVEETVRGIKGTNCHQVTEKINESLGTVIASSPTEELFEQEIAVDQTVTLSNDWDSGSTW